MNIKKKLEKLKSINDSYTIKDMLDDLQKQDSKVYDKKWYQSQVELYGDLNSTVSEQNVFPPDTIEEGIPTLMKNSFKNPSLMIRERFEFCGRWEDAFVMDWLSIEDMKKLWDDKEIYSLFNSIKTNWSCSKISNYNFDEISVFGVDTIENSLILLLWDKDESKEPQIVTYIDFHEAIYKNLDEFISHIIG